jgi:hypothetical protein
MGGCIRRNPLEASREEAPNDQSPEEKSRNPSSFCPQ